HRLRWRIGAEIGGDSSLVCHQKKSVASGNLMHRQFCPTCGTPVFTQSDARLHMIGVRAGTLDDPEIGKPQMTIWTSSAPSCAVFEPNIQQDERQSPTPR